MKNFHFTEWQSQPEIIQPGVIVNAQRLRFSKNKIYPTTANPSIQTSMLIRGFVRNECKQNMSPDDIIDLIIRWTGKIFYFDRDPEEDEFKIYVCYLSEEFFPYLIKHDWSFKKVIQYILEGNSQSVDLYKKVKLWRLKDYGNCQYSPIGAVRIYRLVKGKCSANEHFLCLMYDHN